MLQEKLYGIFIFLCALAIPLRIAYLIHKYLISKTSFGKQINQKPIYKYTFITILGFVIGIIILIFFFGVVLNRGGREH